MTENIQPKRTHVEMAVLVLFILPLINGWYNSHLIHRHLLFWILDAFQFVVIPSCVAIFLFKNSNLKLIDVGLQIPADKSDWTKLAIHSVLVSIAFYYLTKELFLFFEHAFPPNRYAPVFDYGWMVPQNYEMKMISTFYYGLGAGLVEEFYFRGLMVLLFTQYGMRKSLIVLFSTCAFTLIHWEGGPRSIMAVFFLSLVITSYYVRFRLLWPLVIGHFVFDWIWFFQRTP